MPLRLLVVSSETPEQQASRRERSGQASHETLADTLRQLAPDATLEHVCCVTDECDTAPEAQAAHLRGLSGAVFAGSPIQMHEDNEETRRAARFMRRVFEAGTPSFGSCAGLQIAASAAGGTTKPREKGIEAGFARGIVATDAGRDHPILRGRPVSWNALAMHSSVVDRQPDGMTVLAGTKDTPVEAAEVRFGNGVHWGVQYHPEVSLAEIADAIEAKSDGLIEEGMARNEGEVTRYADVLRTLGDDPSRTDLAWQIGVEDDVVTAEGRRVELRNFLSMLG